MKTRVKITGEELGAMFDSDEVLYGDEGYVDAWIMAPSYSVYGIFVRDDGLIIKIPIYNLKAIKEKVLDLKEMKMEAKQKLIPPRSYL